MDSPKFDTAYNCIMGVDLLTSFHRQTRRRRGNSQSCFMFSDSDRLKSVATQTKPADAGWEIKY
ncbi:MAG TPA: hypothetical protein DCQ51_15655 [Planktothrix sp. UBA8407]|nr:hypothetical protein [Planktothrix sp. UBA8407]